MNISLWLTMLLLCEWRYSSGSSIVMICASLVRLMRSIMHASVVDFPDPAAPVTRTSPVLLSASDSTLSGIPRLSGSGTPNLMTLMTAARVPLCLNTFTLNLPRSLMENEKSSSLWLSSCALERCAVSYISSTTALMASGFIIPVSVLSCIPFTL